MFFRKGESIGATRDVKSLAGGQGKPCPYVPSVLWTRDRQGRLSYFG